MAAKHKQPEESPAPKAQADSLILTQAEHAALTDKQKVEFRAKGGTVSNQ